jgi:signal transduction histidine kinase
MRFRSLVVASAVAAAAVGPLAGALLAAYGWPVHVAAPAAALAVIGVGGGFAAWIVRRHAQRVDELAAAVRRYASGDLGGRLGHMRDDELTPLARALDATFRVVDGRVTGLARDRARTEAILAGMVEGVLVVDEVGQVQLVNDAARSMLRLDSTAPGRRYLELIRQPDIVAQISRALHGERPEGAELSLFDEHSRTLVARTAPVTADGRGGAVLVLHDITDLRRADLIRRDFVANVSHELRTPLTAIQGYVEALLDAPLDEAHTRRFLQIIARHSYRMERLVNDLLRLARLDAGQELLDQVTCPVEGLFTGVLGELAPSLDARDQLSRTEIAPDAQTVTGDPTKLHDILRNLVENASNYSPEGSLITLRADLDGPWTCLRVLDEGPGIPEADLVRIFERFYRVDKARSRETGGTGLGLSIVKHLVELHGGHVAAANRPGTGAEFTVRLPTSARGGLVHA